MAFVVRHRPQEGGECIEDVASLDVALARAEALRNEAGISDVRIYRHVPVEFRTYYRAHVSDETSDNATSREGASDAASPSAPGKPAGQAPSPAKEDDDAPPGAMPLGEPAKNDGQKKAGIFNR